MSEKAKRRFWRMHLSTAVVLMLVVSASIGLNLSLRTGRSCGSGENYRSVGAGYGIPIPFYWEYVGWHLKDPDSSLTQTAYGEKAFTNIEYKCLAADIIAIFVLLCGVAAFSECMIRRHEAKRQ